MSSPAFWKDLEQFIHLFNNRVQFPYIVSASKQEFILQRLSQKQKLKLKASSIFLLANTIYCFCIFCWCFKQGNFNKQLTVEQIFLILFEFFISACFISLHFIMSFTPEVLPPILNTMTFLEKKIQSRFGIWFIIYFQNVIQTYLIIFRFPSNQQIQQLGFVLH